ncbi:TonB-dependent receptor [Gallaecimonas sp. GXIMD4217]|uniref:TonB-dependent receptor n=1 Tax=Gallaecimonas sp. GXIMD4217 TaxID=3131927 RepID=UPI00311AFB99
MKKTLLCTAVLASLGLPVLADEADTQVEHILVSASRGAKPVASIPNMVTIITAEELAKQGRTTDNLSTILSRLVPGFSPSREKLSSRGESLRGRDPLYLIDGVPQSNPLRDGARDAHTIDIALIERVEVIHGANAIHGLGASGGIINIVTRKPEGDETAVSLELEGADTLKGDSLGYGAGLALSRALGGTELLLGLNWRDRGRFYDGANRPVGADPVQGDLMDSTSWDGFLKLVRELDQEQRLSLMVNRYELDSKGELLAVDGDFERQIPTTSTKGSPEGEPSYNQVTTLSLDYQHRDFLGQQLSLQLFSQNFHALYGGGAYATFQDPALGEDWVDQSRINAEKLGAKLTLVKNGLAGLALKAVYGVDLFRDDTDQDLALSGRTWVPRSRYDNIAPYLQLDWQLADSLLVTGGLRHERVELDIPDYRSLHYYGAHQVEGGTLDFTETLPNLGLNWQLAEPLRLFANYSEGFAMPDIGRVTRAVNVPGVKLDDFIKLAPVVTENEELGLAYEGDWGRGQISYYQSSSDFGVRLKTNADGFVEVRREATEITGLSAELAFYLGETGTLGLIYGQSEGKSDTDNNGSLESDLGPVNIGPDRVSLYLDGELAAELNGRIQISHLMSRRYHDGDGSESARFDGYTLVDASLGWELGQHQLSLGIDNLLDRTYISHYGQTNGRDSSVFAGRGRTWRLGYRYLF